MRNTNSIVGLGLSIVLVAVLAVPACRWLELREPDGVLYGYTDEVPSPPIKPIRAFFDKTLQHWIEKYFEVHLGFRALLIRSFNELNFRIFREAPKLRLYTTQAHGLYSKMSIESINEELVRRASLEDRYQVEAEKLLRVQRYFLSQGKYFGVVIATSKPYVYSDDLGTRYLVGGGDGIYERTASFGKVLYESGVNVIDGGPLLRKFRAATGIDTHPKSGVHWNYYAGCLVARQLIDDIRHSQFPKMPMLDCGIPQMAESHMVDIDGLLLLNIWSNGGITKPSPYPVVDRTDDSVWRPNIVFIGDSFSDQIRFALQQANIYLRMTTSGYFRVREIDDRVANLTIAADIKADESAVREDIMKDIANSEVIILEMVDYNVGRWGYGFSDYVLQNFSSQETIH